MQSSLKYHKNKRYFTWRTYFLDHISLKIL